MGRWPIVTRDLGGSHTCQSSLRPQQCRTTWSSAERATTASTRRPAEGHRVPATGGPAAIREALTTCQRPARGDHQTPADHAGTATGRCSTVTPGLSHPAVTDRRPGRTSGGVTTCQRPARATTRTPADHRWTATGQMLNGELPPESTQAVTGPPTWRQPPGGVDPCQRPPGATTRTPEITAGTATGQMLTVNSTA